MVISAKLCSFSLYGSFCAGAALAFRQQDRLRRDRTPLSVISFLAALSAIMTLVPFLFFSQPRTVDYFGGFLSFRIEPVACTAAIFLSVFAAGFSVWLGANYRQPEIGPVFTLLLVAMGICHGKHIRRKPAVDGALYGADSSGIAFPAEEDQDRNGVRLDA